MKLGLYILILSLFISKSTLCQVAIGTSMPSQKAMLDVRSQIDGTGSYRGFLPSRVPSVAAREGISTTSTDNGMLVYVEATGCLSIFNGTFWENIKCAGSLPVKTDVWINEIHYDNAGADVGEFIEIAGLAGLDITGYELLLYNGANGNVYGSQTLSGIIPDSTSGFGFLEIDFPGVNIQNDIEGVALVDTAGTVIQFLSYEGVFTANDGAAVGETSINIPVSENGTDTAGSSLQLAGGPGSVYADFMWSPSATSTPGTVNNGQTFN